VPSRNHRSYLRSSRHRVEILDRQLSVGSWLDGIGVSWIGHGRSLRGVLPVKHGAAKVSCAA
jgi:hypothetical protein